MVLPAQVLSLNAIANVGGDDPHLAKGAHLRWTSHPALGLPNGPVDVSGAMLGQKWWEECPKAVLTRDDHGRASVSDVTLSSSDVLWARPPIGAQGDCLAISVRGEGLTPHNIVGGFQSADRFTPVAYASRRGLDGAYWITAAGVDVVQIKGPGRVEFARCYPLNCFGELDYKPIGYVGPPFFSAGRYRHEPLGDPHEEAFERVRVGAPTLEALQDAIEPTVIAPRAIRPEEEAERVRLLVQGGLEELYLELLSETSGPVQRLRRGEVLVGASGATAATVKSPLLHVLLSATRDASVARWAGMSMVDVDAPESPVLYRIRASFDMYGVDFEDERFAIYAERVLRESADFEGLRILEPRQILTAYALALPGQPPERPPAPRPIGAEQARWLTGGASPERLVRVGFDKPATGVGYAWFRRDDGAQRPLNPQHDAGFRLLATTATTHEARLSDRRHLSDRAAPASSGVYGVAAVDGFGRWSDWSAISLPRGVLSRPPKPAPFATYLPAPRDPVDNQLRSGRIEVVVPLPDEEPPGVAPIDRLVVTATGPDGYSASATVVARSGMGDATVVIDGPPLSRASRMEVTVAAEFSAGALNSEPGRIPTRAVDPRPPVGLSVTPEIHWATRPDGRDSSRLVLEWRANADHYGYRVYVASIRTMVPYLTDLGSAGEEALAAINDRRIDKQSLAAALESHRAALPRSAFELVTAKPIKAFGLPRKTFETWLPGRSTLLYLFRVSAIGENGVEEAWSDAPASFWAATPPSVKLQPPELRVVAPKDDGSGAALEVTAVLRENQRAAALRIYRTANPSAATAGSMALIYDAPLSLTPPSADAVRPDLAEPLAEIVYQDRGAHAYDKRAQLKPWTRYVYRAQIRSPAEPGGPDGVWSELGPPAASTFISDDDPPAAQVWPRREASGVALVWVANVPVKRTPLGDFAYRVMRQTIQEATPTELAFVSALEKPEFFDDTVPPSGDAHVYWIETVDPIGRRTVGQRVRVAG